jgi:antitoxin component YwqK of YwqJK toxin-antitoxin module
MFSLCVNKKKNEKRPLALLLKNTRIHLEYFPSGCLASKEWFFNGKHHRIDGPASIRYHENGMIMIEKWYINDIWHRIGGPAIIYYHENGTISSEEWYFSGKLHRMSGPDFIIMILEHC